MTRLLAIGDVHGCLTALDTLLGFARPTLHDQLVFLGDYVDRGPDSRGVLERLIELKRTGQVVCLRGNHEIMMLGAAQSWSAFQFWLQCGGADALESYVGGREVVTPDDIPEAHWRFVEKACVDWYEADAHVFVHANLHPDTPLASQSSDWLHWQFLNPTWHRPHVSGKTMICGHTEQRDGNPVQLERAICIDTYCYGDGWLTCLDVASGEYWQANELGETRTGRL
jgi:Calcineurin-like phosphoesterase